MNLDDVLRSLARAVEAEPQDHVLRLHLAHLLDEAGYRDAAVQQASIVLQVDPTNADAIDLIAQGPRSHTDGASGPLEPDVQLSAHERAELANLAAALGEALPDSSAPGTEAGQRPSLSLADVGGMAEVKRRIDEAFLAPNRNPTLRAHYGASVTGGLLLYGPPGCGKTFIARALAGELGANFVAITLADVLDMFLGQSEQNIHEVFERARAAGPSVLFFDEVDALGQKRSQLRNSALRGTINQFLSEFDGVAADNEGLYVIGATNHPWDVDPALRRPGRFEQMVYVGLPDEGARRSILELHLSGKPLEAVDLAKLVTATDGYSGADLAHVCNLAAQRALTEALRSGEVRGITTADLEAAREAVLPSTGPWFETARNVVEFANDDGSYDELAAQLRRRRRRS